MKAAMLALGVFVIGLVGFTLVNLFGNITVTDQLNYTTMKNAVEASMYDAIDKTHYEVGFCLCTNKDMSTDRKWFFDSESEYELSDIKFEGSEEKCESELRNCTVLHGEYQINAKIFSESLIRRVGEMVNNNKDYEITIQDVIEYPPKVSVRVSSKDDEYLPTDKRDGYVIVNQMDAIMETDGGKIEAVPIPSPTPTATPASSGGSGGSSGGGGSPSGSGGSSDGSTCTWHYYATKVKCKPNSYYVTKPLADSSHQPKCASGYSIYISSCDKDGCHGYCYKSYSDTDFNITLRSSRNSSSTKSAAVKACHQAAESWCKKQNGYSGAKSDNCAAVRDYKLSGYNNNGQAANKTITDQKSQPSCSSAGLKSGCTSQCLG